LITLIKQIAPNFIRLGLIQASSILLQLLLIPIVIQRAGLEANGKLLTALSVSVLFSIVINFASNQSGPLALHQPSGTINLKYLHEQLNLLLYIRLLFFVASLLIIIGVYCWHKEFGLYLVGIIPLLFSEVINPYVLCLSANNLQSLSVLNLLGRFLGLALVYFLWKDASTAYWVNGWVGLSLCIFFMIFWMVEVIKGGFRLQPVSVRSIRKHLKENSSLVGSNLIVHFQQALFLYVIGIIASPVVLGIYAIVDKIVWGCRTLLISFSGAVYAASLKIITASVEEWARFRQRINQLLFLGLLSGALFLFLFAEQLAFWLGKPIYFQALVNAIRVSAIIPVFTGLNLMNVLELLLKKKHTLIYTTNLRVLGIVVLLSGCLYGIHHLKGELPFWIPVLALLMVELITLLAYEKTRRHIS
jgi:polysaccharide transporter, PST family